MEFSGEYRIPAKQEIVWLALNDPEILRLAVPGCEEITPVSDTVMNGIVTAKVGPVKVRFKGVVTLADVDAPNSYNLIGEGKGGAAGFAKGEARVTLTADGDETILVYEATSMVGGKLAQIGTRLIEGTAKKLTDEFFTSFNELASVYTGAAGESVPEPLEPGAQPDEPSESGVETSGLSPAIWIPTLIAAIAAALWLFS